MDATTAAYAMPSRHSARRRNAEISLPVVWRTAGILVVSAAVIVSVAALFSAPGRPAPVSWTAVSVAESGTLWGLAAEHPVSGLSTAETIDLIVEENGLTSSVLHAGQTVVVPSVSDDSVALVQR